MRTEGLNPMIKKINILLLCSFVLTACSFSTQQQVVTAAPTRVLSPTPTASITPTRPTPTFTLTPTLVGYKSPTPTPEDTATLTATVTSAFDSITPSTPTPFVKMDGFTSIKTSSHVFYRGQECSPTSVNFTAVTPNSTNAEFVVLFTRFVSQSTGAKSEWTSITMESDGRGTFTHDLVPQEMKAADSYIDPWVQFQFVATDIKSNEVGRTDIFDKQLSLQACVLTPTPTITITPTVLKP
jgi:hypothetical protein